MAATWTQPVLEFAQNFSTQALDNAASSKPVFSLEALPSHILYAGTDLNSLSWIEKLWAAWYIKIGDPVLATGILAFILHEFVYFGRCVPFMIMDQIPYFKRWKLQDNKAPTWEQQWKCTKLVLLTHFTVELPQIWGFHPMAEYLGMATHRVPFPAWTTMAWQIGLFFFLEDMWHYWAHRTMHEIPYLYKNVHKLHHEFSAPFGLAAEYAHPIEIMVLGIGTIGGPLLVCWLMGGNVHLFTVLVFITLRLFQAVDAHSGYDFPVSLRHFVPFWSGADHHDFHHMNFIGCYSTSFRWWDHFMGTDSSYQRYKLRKAAAKLQGNDMNYVPYEMEGKAREQALLNKADGKSQ